MGGTGGCGENWGTGFFRFLGIGGLGLGLGFSGITGIFFMAGFGFFFRSGESTNRCGFRNGFFTGDPITCAGILGGSETGAAEDRFSPVGGW